jgi:hypothetical protein
MKRKGGQGRQGAEGWKRGRGDVGGGWSPKTALCPKAAPAQSRPAEQGHSITRVHVLERIREDVVILSSLVYPSIRLLS